MNWYQIDNIEKLDTPALVVYPSRIKHNIATMLSMARNPLSLRPHVKTHKSPHITQLLIEAGIQKFKCATIAEAEMLGICGAPDVLLTYQPAGPKVDRLIQLVLQYPHTQYSCLIDDLETAKALGKSFAGHKLNIRVYLDLNTGMNRSGIRVENAASLWYAADAVNGVIPVGLHVYDGHIRNPDFTARKKLCNDEFEPVLLL